RTDLAAFDSRTIALAVARSPRPVLTGLGHEIDQAVADLVAHQAFKTPTKVAEFLVARLIAAETSVARVAARLVASSRLPLSSARERLLDAARRVAGVRLRLVRRGERLTVLGAALARAARGRLAAAATGIEARARLVAGLSPARTLARGF